MESRKALCFRIHFSFFFSQSASNVFHGGCMGGKWNPCMSENVLYYPHAYWPGIDTQIQSCIFLKSRKALFHCLLTSRAETPSLMAASVLSLARLAGLVSDGYSRSLCRSLCPQSSEIPPVYVLLFVFVFILFSTRFACSLWRSVSIIQDWEIFFYYFFPLLSLFSFFWTHWMLDVLHLSLLLSYFQSLFYFTLPS